MSLLIATLIALLWTAVVTLWLWRNQERVVFQPPSDAPPAPSPAKRVEYAADDGHELFGYLLSPVSGASSTVVIAFHGNADLAAWTAPWARELSERAGVTVLVPEYRGYGGIPGVPTYVTSASDARGALNYVTRELRPERVVLFGHSLGTAIATELAADAKAKVAALLLQSPFTSAREMALRMLVPPMPGLWRAISRVHYDTRAAVEALDVPVFVSHGTRDINVPARMGRSVFAAARRPGQMLLVDGAGHNDVADVGGDAYWQWIVNATRATS